MILNWQNTYKERLTDAKSALSKIKRGARIFIGSACGEPQLYEQEQKDKQGIPRNGVAGGDAHTPP